MKLIAWSKSATNAASAASTSVDGGGGGAFEPLATPVDVVAVAGAVGKVEIFFFNVNVGC